MSPDITVAAALIGGIVSFLSPCVLPLVPPYLVYLAGTSLQQRAEIESPRSAQGHTILAAVLFVAGLSTVFIALGAGASTLGGVLRHYMDELAIVAGLVIIAMGLHFLGLTRIGALMRHARIDVSKPASLGGAYVMGLAFSFGWTPCVGPILAAILAIAASEATVAKGAGLLAIFSLGLGLPFVAAAFAIKPVTGILARFRRHLGHVERATGALLVLTGIAFLTGFMGQASAWLLETFPALGEIGWSF